MRFDQAMGDESVRYADEPVMITGYTMTANDKTHDERRQERETMPDNASLTDSQIAARQMSDDDLERRTRAILGGNTDHLDQDLVRQCRHISDRRAGK